MNVFKMIGLIKELTDEQKHDLYICIDENDVLAVANKYGLMISQAEASEAFKYIDKYRDLLK